MNSFNGTAISSEWWGGDGNKKYLSLSQTNIQQKDCLGVESVLPFPFTLLSAIRKQQDDERQTRLCYFYDYFAKFGKITEYYSYWLNLLKEKTLMNFIKYLIL